MSIINAITDEVITIINVVLLPRSVDIAPEGSFVFVTNSAGNSVVVIDGFSNSVIGQIALESQSQPSSVVVSPDASRVYVANRGTDNVAAIELLSVGTCSGFM